MHFLSYTQTTTSTDGAATKSSLKFVRTCGTRLCIYWEY